MTLAKSLLAICLASASLAFAQKTEVPENVMQQIYEEVKTPYKYGMVMEGADKDKKTDCPTIVRKGGMWYMYYFVYDGRGYETWLAKSKDLLHWDNLGRVLSFSDENDWDCNQKGGYIALPDYKWDGSYKLNKYDGKYWISYFGSNTTGYEQGDLAIGMAYTTGNPYVAHEWDRLPSPVLTPKDADVSWWDNKKLYKNSIIRDEKRLTGHEFVMYYNACGPYEAIGMATSDDMVHWKRYGTEPLLDHGKYITGDAYIQKIGDVYVMFYFGCGWNPNKKVLAWNTFACSYDLIHWTDWKGEELIKSSEPYDKKFAHKSCVVKWKGVVYHFYCAVDKDDNRGIALATSKDLSASK